MEFGRDVVQWLMDEGRGDGQVKEAGRDCDQARKGPGSIEHYSNPQQKKPVLWPANSA